jgi:hypothetical protein
MAYRIFRMSSYVFVDHNDRTYAVPYANAFEPAAAWYFPLYLSFVFCARRAQKTKLKKKMKYRCE